MGRIFGTCFSINNLPGAGMVADGPAAVPGIAAAVPGSFAAAAVHSSTAVPCWWAVRGSWKVP